MKIILLRIHYVNSFLFEQFSTMYICFVKMIKNIDVNCIKFRKLGSFLLRKKRNNYLFSIVWNLHWANDLQQDSGVQLSFEII